MLILLINALKNRLAESRDRRALQRLLAKEDHILRDVGLTRPDIESALAKPFRIAARAEATRLSRLSLMLDRAV